MSRKSKPDDRLTAEFISLPAEDPHTTRDKVTPMIKQLQTETWGYETEGWQEHNHKMHTAAVRALCGLAMGFENIGDKACQARAVHSIEPIMTYEAKNGDPVLLDLYTMFKDGSLSHYTFSKAGMTCGRMVVPVDAVCCECGNDAWLMEYVGFGGCNYFCADCFAKAFPGQKPLGVRTDPVARVPVFLSDKTGLPGGLLFQLRCEAMIHAQSVGLIIGGVEEGDFDPSSGDRNMKPIDHAPLLQSKTPSATNIGLNPDIYNSKN